MKVNVPANSSRGSAIESFFVEHSGDGMEGSTVVRYCAQDLAS